MIARVTYAQQQAVLAERAKGRTDRQIEKIIGLQTGTLARPYAIDVSEEAERCRAERAVAEWRKRDERFWRARARDRSVIHGWRPAGDCVRSRPDAKPLRAVPRRQGHRHG